MHMQRKAFSISITITLVVLAFGAVGASAQSPVISPWTTGIDLQNLTDSQATFAVDFYNSTGTKVYTYTPASPLAARGGANIYVPNIPDTSLPAGQYSAIVSSDAMVAAVASLQSYSSSNPQFGGADIYLGTSEPAALLRFPLVYRNHTARHWYTTLVIQNASTSAQDVELKLFNSGSSTEAYTKQVNIPANASYSFDLQDAEYVAFGPFGSATVTGSAPLAGIAFNLLLGRMTDPNTNYLDTINSQYRGFVDSQLGTTVVAPLVYKNYNLWTTGINVVNTTGTSTDVTVTFRNANPAISGGPWTETKTVGANSMEVFYTPANATGLPDGFYGSAELVSTVSPIAVVVASQRYRPTGAEGVAYEGSLPGSATACASLPVSHNRTTWKTGINILNMGGAEGTFTLNYYSSASGIPNAGPQTINIPANSPQTVYMPTQSPTQIGFYGAVDIKGTQPFLVNVANSRTDTTSHGVASNYVGVNYVCP
jgi:hypothetical protein